jgi:hypothetical protein
MTTSILSGPEFYAKWATVNRHRSAPTRTQAYMYSGQWVADCCYPDCYNTQALISGAMWYHCCNCRHVAEVDWPVDAEQIDAALAIRPVPGTRNWAPAGHRQAIQCGFPEGQTVADLVEETEANL